MLYNIVMIYKSNNNIVYSSKYHVVWCTKYRRKVLIDNSVQRLKNILGEVCKERRADLISSEVMEDHVHLLIEIDPQYGIHKLVKQLKGRSSRYLRKEYEWMRTRLPTLWTNSYFVSTVGGAPLAAIKQYVEQQKNK